MQEFKKFIQWVMDPQDAVAVIAAILFWFAVVGQALVGVILFGSLAYAVAGGWAAAMAVPLAILIEAYCLYLIGSWAREGGRA